jgi:hypothetical protein
MLPSRRYGSAVGSLYGLNEVDLEVRSAWFESSFWGMRPINCLGIGDPQGSVLFSGKREGFALYFARLVRPIWGSKVTVVK